MASTPTTEPTVIYAGDSVSWTKQFQDFSPANGDSLSYVMARGSGRETFSGVANSTNTGWDIDLLTTATELWSPGFWQWTSTLTNGANRTTAEQGRFEIRPNPADTDEQVETVLYYEGLVLALRCTMMGKATKDQEAYSIQGIQVTKMNPTELREWLVWAERQERRERRKLDAGQGIRSPNKILVEAFRAR